MSQQISSVLTRDYPAGTVLFEEHEPGSRMFVIRKGKVKIFKRHGDREIVLAFMGPGEFFGEMALLEGLPRSACALAMEPTTLIEVDSQTFDEMIRRNPEIAVRMMRRLASRVRQLDLRLERLMVDNALGRALEILRWLAPQGLLEKDWIRIRGVGTHLDIAAQAGIPATQADSVRHRLEDAACIKLEGEDLLIAHREHLEEYAGFLDLKRKYDPHGTEEQDTQLTQEDALKRLLNALKLTGEEINERRENLSSQYARFVELKSRFGQVESKE